MSDHIPKRRTMEQIKNAWLNDIPVNSAELAAFMEVARSTVNVWKASGMPCVGSLVRRSSFDKWWNAAARKSSQTKVKSSPERIEPTAPVPHVAKKARTNQGDGKALIRKMKRQGSMVAFGSSDAPMNPKTARLLAWADE